MRKLDQQRFSAMIADFVEGCDFERPFYLVAIDARGTASVTRYGFKGVEQVCSGPVKSNRLRMIPPLVATVISSDGCGKSAKIEIVAAKRYGRHLGETDGLVTVNGWSVQLSLPVRKRYGE